MKSHSIFANWIYHLDTVKWILEGEHIFSYIRTPEFHFLGQPACTKYAAFQHTPSHICESQCGAERKIECDDFVMTFSEYQDSFALFSRHHDTSWVFFRGKQPQQHKRLKRAAQHSSTNTNKRACLFNSPVL